MILLKYGCEHFISMCMTAWVRLWACMCRSALTCSESVCMHLQWSVHAYNSVTCKGKRVWVHVPGSVCARVKESVFAHLRTFARECERASVGCVLCLCCQVCAHMFVRAHAHMEGGYRVKPLEAEAQNTFQVWVCTWQK